MKNFFDLLEGMTPWQIAGEFLGAAGVLIVLPGLLALVYVAAGFTP
jgi:hypothetical protein